MAELLNAELLASFGVLNNQIACDTGETLQVLAIARILPKARLVCKCLLNTQEVYAKIFIGLRANIHAGRELGGMNLLKKANILTPNILLYTTTKSHPILVYVAIKNAINAESYMQNSDYLSRQKLAEKLTQTVAQHHQANLLQTDIHLKNFLLADDSIYTIDGDGIVKASSNAKKLRNLATLLSKFDVLDDDGIYGAYNVYCQQRSIKNSPKELAAVWALTQTIRRQSASYFADKKVFRQCSDVNVVQKKGFFAAYTSQLIQTNLPQTIEQAETYFTQNNLLKDGNTCTVALAEVDNKKIVLKRYNIKSFWHGFSRAIRQTRASSSWANAHRLNILGVVTAAPIALIEERMSGFLNLKVRAYFLAEYVDAPDVAEYFAKTSDKTQRAQAVKNIVTLFYKLYLLQISHGDMKASNIKMQGKQPVLIDLDSMRQHRKSNIGAHVRDLQRFMQNWKDNASLYNAFVKTFKVIYPDDSLLIKAGIATNKE